PSPGDPTIVAPLPRTFRPFSGKSSRQSAERSPPIRQDGDPLPRPPDPTRHEPPTRIRRQSDEATGNHSRARLPPSVPCFCDWLASSLGDSSGLGGQQSASRAENAARSAP